TLQLGWFENRVGGEQWASAVEFSGITFDHAAAETHSILVYNVDGFVLDGCTVKGDGEYGIGSTGNNPTTPGSVITNCTFENAGMQISGGFGSDLEISDCTFNDSRVNIQGGNGVNFSGNTFNSTVTDANVGDSFYCIRSNDIAVNIEDCVFNIDSTLTEDAGEQAKWGVLWQRNAGNTQWVANDIEVNYTDAALAQGELLFNKNGTTTAANETDRITINGVTSTSNDVDAITAKSEGALNVVNEGTYSIYDDGVLVNSATASTVYVNSTYTAGADLGEGKLFGFNAFADFASAMAAARDNDLVSRIEIESDITSNSNVDTENYYDIAQKLTIGAASGGKFTVSAGSLAILVMGDGASLTIEDGVTVENLDVVADGYATSNEEMIINGEMKALSLKVWTNNKGITVNETGKVALGYGDGQLDLAYGNGYLTVNGTLENTKEESLTDGPQFKAGYSGTRGAGNTINLNNTYMAAGSWFNVEGSNGTFNLDNSVMKIGGGDAAGSLTVSNSGNVFNVNNGSRLVVENLTLGANNTISLDGSSLELKALTNNGTITLDAASLITANTLTGTGTITIDAAEYSTGVKVLIDLNGKESLKDKVAFENLAEGVNVIYGADGDVALSDAEMTTLVVNAEYADKKLGEDLGNGKFFGINTFATLGDAVAAATSETTEIRVASNVTEALSGKTLSGSIVKDGDDTVIITDSANDNYVNFRNFTLGKGVTVDAKYINLGSGENTINGNIKSGTTLYSLGSTVTTITGNVEAYTTMSRKYTTAGAGIYVVGTAAAGEGKNADVQYKSTNYLGHYSGTFSVKDTAAEFGYILLGYAQEHTGSEQYSQGVLKLDNASVKTIGGPNTQPGQLLMVDGTAIEAINDSVIDIRGPKDFGYLSMESGTSLSLTDSTLRLGREGQGGNSLNGSVTLVNSTIDSLGKIVNNGTITIDATSLITATDITGNGTITIDATVLNGVSKVIDLSAESLEGKVTILGDGVTAIYGADGDVTITNASTKTVYYDAAWAGKTAGEDLGDGKVFGVNAFSEFVDNGVNSSGWSNLLILPEDTTEIVLAAGNADSAEYGKIRPTQDLVVKTSGEGYAVVDRIVNMGVDLVIDEDAKVKVLTATGLSGANNQGGALIVNGELYFANANSGNKAIYLWGMNSTPGQLVINAGGLLKADAGNIENHGTVTVLGTMELGKAGDAPKLAGV
ncbi:MAG: right-handed parallel beta-helix repeat-containing protein, partial [Lentisphaeria bacterium]|nr:right-handed parallel beta-helix repeat-containing protein [Lentisphaeria bacterium]